MGQDVIYSFKNHFSSLAGRSINMSHEKIDYDDDDGPKRLGTEQEVCMVTRVPWTALEGLGRARPKGALSPSPPSVSSTHTCKTKHPKGNGREIWHGEKARAFWCAGACCCHHHQKLKDQGLLPAACLALAGTQRILGAGRLQRQEE